MCLHKYVYIHQKPSANIPTYGVHRVHMMIDVRVTVDEGLDRGWFGRALQRMSFFSGVCGFFDEMLVSF